MTQVDLIGPNGGQGDVAAYAAKQGSLNANMLRPWIGKDKKIYVTVHTGGDPANPKNYKAVPYPVSDLSAYSTTLRRDEWKQLDEAILETSRTRLGGVQDLIDRGLVYNLGNGMGTTVLEWHDVSDSMSAELSMDGVTKSEGDRPKFSTNYLPIPIIHVDYEINTRALEASRSLGNPLDVTSAEHAARKVNEKLEQMLFTDTSYTFSANSGSIKSYVNHGSRNTVTLSAYGNWDDSGTSAREILDSVIAMKQASIDAKHYGPWMLYIPTNYETVLDDDYEDTGQTSTGRTIRQRIKEISGIMDIKVVDTLADDNVLLVQMTSDVVRLVRGMALSNVFWQTEGKFINKYKVMTIQVPQIRSDQSGNSGIVHMS